MHQYNNPKICISTRLSNLNITNFIASMCEVQVHWKWWRSHQPQKFWSYLIFLVGRDWQRWRPHTVKNKSSFTCSSNLNKTQLGDWLVGNKSHVDTHSKLIKTNTTKCKFSFEWFCLYIIFYLLCFFFNFLFSNWMNWRTKLKINNKDAWEIKISVWIELLFFYNTYHLVVCKITVISFNIKEIQRIFKTAKS